MFIKLCLIWVNDKYISWCEIKHQIIEISLQTVLKSSRILCLIERLLWYIPPKLWFSWLRCLSHSVRFPVGSISWQVKMNIRKFKPCLSRITFNHSNHPNDLSSIYWWPVADLWDGANHNRLEPQVLEGLRITVKRKEFMLNIIFRGFIEK